MTDIIELIENLSNLGAYERNQIRKENVNELRLARQVTKSSQSHDLTFFKFLKKSKS